MGESVVYGDPYGRFDYSGGFKVEPESWPYAVCPVGGVAFDVGAHVGKYAFKFSQLVGDGGRVFAFEPGHYAYGILRRNVELFGMENISCFPYALSDYDGVGVLFSGLDGTDATHNNFLMRSSVEEPFYDMSFEDIFGYDFNFDHHMEVVRVMKIDTFVESNEVDRMDILKVDVEGAELKVLEGAKNSLKMFSPLLYVEVHYGHDVAGAVSGLGYRVLHEFDKVRGTTNPIVVLGK